MTTSARVNSLAQRKAAERAAKRVAGIKTLVIEIRAAIIPGTVTKFVADPQNDYAEVIFKG